MTDPAELCEQAVSMVESDPGAAYRFFSEAAEAGSANGMFGMAELKMSGTGTPADPDGAERLYLEASATGHAPSMYRLGTLWAGGAGP